MLWCYLLSLENIAVKTEAILAPVVTPRSPPCPEPTYKMIKKIAAALLLSCSAAAVLAVPMGSQSVLVVEDGTGKILLEKNATDVVPIASLTKLMTAYVVFQKIKAGQLNVADMEALARSLKLDMAQLAHVSGIGERNEFQASIYHLDNNNGVNYGIPYIAPYAGAPAMQVCP